MAAGLGFKTFTTGEVLTAADTNGYLMQGINVFASTAARDAAITSPQEGQFAFTKDTNGLWYYDGAAWVASGATGDIEGVSAGIGISGGGTSGTVTVTNSMATAIDAKGDLVPGTGADTFSRLAVGANDTVLTADSSAATGMKWATPASGGLSWTAFTPTWGNLTVGNGTVIARQATSNDYETLFIQLTFGSTTSVTGSVYVNTPTTGVIDYSFNTGTCSFFDVSSGIVALGIATTGTDGGVQRVFPNILNSTSTYTTLTAITSTVPYTWATGDILAINIYYEF